MRKIDNALARVMFVLLLAGCDNSSNNKATTSSDVTNHEAPITKAANLALPRSGSLDRNNLLAYISEKDVYDQTIHDRYAKSFNDKVLLGRHFSVTLAGEEITDNYDADKENLEISISLSDAIGVGDVLKGNSYYLPLFKSHSPIAPKTMENAFGVQKEVTGEDTISYGIGGVENSPGLFRAHQYLFPSLKKTLHLPPDKAKDMNQTGYVATVTGIVRPLPSGHAIDCGSYIHSPDLTSPTDGTDRYCVLSVHFTSAVITTKNGTKLASWN